MTQVVGTLKEVSTKNWYDPKAGREIQLQSFKINESNKWYRTGTTPVTLPVGSLITFDADDKNRVGPFKNPRVELAPQGAAPSAPAPAAAAASSGGGGVTRDDYWKNREERDLAKEKKYQEEDIPRMTFSSAQDRAVALVAAALQHDALSFGNMAKGKKFDYVMELVQTVTNQFLMDAMHSHQRFAHLLENGLEGAADVDADEPEVPEEY